MVVDVDVDGRRLIAKDTGALVQVASCFAPNHSICGLRSGGRATSHDRVHYTPHTVLVSLLSTTSGYKYNYVGVWESIPYCMYSEYMHLKRE